VPGAKNGVRPEVETIAVAEVRDGAATEVAASLEDRDGASGAGEIDSGRESRKAATDDDHIF
jgi:hypothetical protein